MPCFALRVFIQTVCLRLMSEAVERVGCSISRFRSFKRTTARVCLCTFAAGGLRLAVLRRASIGCRFNVEACSYSVVFHTHDLLALGNSDDLDNVGPMTFG